MSSRSPRVGAREAARLNHMCASASSCGTSSPSRYMNPRLTCVLASPCSARVRSASISDVCACTGTPSATSSDLLGTQDVWRSPEVPSELGDVVHIRPLGMRGELPHLHVFEHAASKGGHGTLL